MFEIGLYDLIRRIKKFLIILGLLQGSETFGSFPDPLLTHIPEDVANIIMSYQTLGNLQNLKLTSKKINAKASPHLKGKAKKIKIDPMPFTQEEIEGMVDDYHIPKTVGSISIEFLAGKYIEFGTGSSIFIEKLFAQLPNLKSLSIRGGRFLTISVTKNVVKCT